VGRSHLAVDETYPLVIVFGDAQFDPVCGKLASYYGEVTRQADRSNN
jgi:hypothetical protein